MADDATAGAPAAGGDAAAAAAAQAQAAAAAQAAASAKATADAERIAQLEANIKALSDTVKGALTARTTATADGRPAVVTPETRAMLRQQGLTDADIDHNAPLIQPFLQATLASVGPQIFAPIQRVEDELTMLKASRNGKAYPWWGVLEDRIIASRDEAQKSGQYLTPKQAYDAAVANDMASSESRIDAERARRAAAGSVGSDVSAQNLTHHGAHAGGTGQRRGAITAEDLNTMSREDRKKFFDSVAETPIR